MVLDPFSAIGLAANILQFVDFSYKVIADAKEIYQSVSGSTCAHAELQSITESFVRLSSTFERPPDDARTTATTAEQEICKLAISCKSIADELIATIQNLQIRE